MFSYRCNSIRMLTQKVTVEYSLFIKKQPLSGLFLYNITAPLWGQLPNFFTQTIFKL